MKKLEVKIRLLPEVKARLTAIAEKEGRSVSALCVLLIIDGLRRIYRYEG